MIPRAHAHRVPVDAVVLVGPGARIPLLIEMLSTTTRAQLIVSPGRPTAIAMGCCPACCVLRDRRTGPRAAAHPLARPASRRIGRSLPARRGEPVLPERTSDVAGDPIRPEPPRAAIWPFVGWAPSRGSLFHGEGLGGERPGLLILTRLFAMGRWLGFFERFAEGGEHFVVPV
jgi:hypothetical protein